MALADKEIFNNQGLFSCGEESHHWTSAKDFFTRGGEGLETRRKECICRHVDPALTPLLVTQE